MHKRLVLLVAAILLSGATCRPARSGTLIDAYRAARCITPTVTKGVHSTRGWDSTIEIADGSNVAVHGAEVVWGRITLRYETDGRELVAVDAGDYIYPADVRMNERRDRMYVKASGLAGGLWHETRLYEYDLVKRRQVRKTRVHPDVLPPECAIANK